jgi:hypothetical protein
LTMGKFRTHTALSFGAGSPFRSMVAAAILLAFVAGWSADAVAAARTAPKKTDERIDALEALPYDSGLFIKKKDPIFAGMLSWYIPGLGQFYTGNYIKGTAFLVSEYALAITAVFYFMNFDFSAGGGSGFSMKVDAKRTDLGLVSTSRKNIFIGMVSFLFVLHIYNVTDAALSARSFNMELDKSRLKLREKYPSLDFSVDDRGGFYIGLRKQI